jgi:DNA-binding response OmpR family regulator
MPKVVLIADDDPGVLVTLVELLDSEGFEVKSAHDGAEALEIHAREPADLILSDIMMPVVDGHTMVEGLRLRDDWTPVVLMSAGDHRIYHRPGVWFIPKPFDLNALLALLREGLSMPQLPSMPDLPAHPSAPAATFATEAGAEDIDEDAGARITFGDPEPS